MDRRKKWLAGGAVAAVLAGGAGIAAAGGSDDDSTPITGDALARASEAALAHTGGGTVTDSEVGDEEGYYEVEVTRQDGQQVDVHLDRDFAVLDSEADDDAAGEDDDEGDDEDD